MNILMLTNTYLPHVGGVARSVEAFANEFRRHGHRVLIVAPQFEGMSADEQDVIRMPAIQNFNGSDFSVRLPIPGLLIAALRDFQPEIIHSHHPFLLGDTALRVAARWNVPLVFTHHTMYENYTHYVPGDSPALRRFVVDLATGYANLCDQIVAPSESVAAVLRERGIETPIDVVPTGVDTIRFGEGNGQRLRADVGIPSDAFVVGHLGRLAPEKNLPLLAEAVSTFLRKHRRAHFLLVGAGPSEQEVRRIFARKRLEDRLHMVGVVKGQELVNAYHAMDVFAFASLSETQGMVLTEAMAAGVPVVAIDAPGAREVVTDGRNGRLLAGQQIRPFVAALAWVAERNVDQRLQLQQAALKTAESFSMANCAQRALALYRSLVGDTPSQRVSRAANVEDSAWGATLRFVDAEWNLWTARASAARTVLQGNYLPKIPVLGWLRHTLRRMRRAVSRNEWLAWLLGLPRSGGTAAEPGLIMIQIDGLSRTQFEHALHRRYLPFLRRLMTREGYRLQTMYSGLPSSTPSVQAELFYGVKSAVPSFNFRDHETGKVVRMFDAEPAAKVQKWLGAQGRGLLEGGSAYCDIYSGGATEAHFCAATFGWGDFLRTANPLSLAAFVAFHAPSALRIATLLVVESILAVVDCCRGVIAGQDLWKELTLVPARVGVCVLLREMITAGACVDATRGLPVIHLNLLGYDEQAHRRGPGSAFAMWTLRGIDRAIKRIWDAAQRSRRRDYHVWIYSDHGQEHTTPYPVLAGKPIQEAVAEVLQMSHAADEHHHRRTRGGEQFERSQWLGGHQFQKLMQGRVPPFVSSDGDRDQSVLVTSMGPIGHVYTPEPLSPEQGEDAARRLVAEAKVPLVLVSGEGGKLIAWNERGRFELPRDAAQVLGGQHPFLEEVTADLIALCRHPDAGELLISGWTPHEKSISFPQENGAHAGPGFEETRAFALLPAEIPLPAEGQLYLRPGDLREEAFEILHRPTHAPRSRRKRPRTDTLRILTYNVHSCIGLDGKLSPSRIARMIAQCEPDIVALQELDVGRAHTQEIDQAHEIARELEMEYHFQPTVQVEEEQYGNAVLSCFPLKLVHAGPLPLPPDRKDSEPRGAIWVAVSVNGQELHLINTHLGLSPYERLLQVNALLGDQWLGHPEFREPSIVCGDFNAFPRSKVHKRLCSRLRDAQLSLGNHRPQRTWSSQYPIGRIDHVFLSKSVEVVAIQSPRSQLARTASDHLPLVIEVRVK